LAFTEEQEDQIRQYLGFAAGFYQYNTRLESMLDKVGDNAVEKASVEAIMAKIVLVETAIASGGTAASTTGALKEIVGDVSWYEPGESSSTFNARSYGAVLINRLAARFGYSRDELPSDYFGTGGSRGGEMALG
jgi:hypothetical protein